MSLCIFFQLCPLVFAAGSLFSPVAIATQRLQYEIINTGKEYYLSRNVTYIIVVKLIKSQPMQEFPCFKVVPTDRLKQQLIKKVSLTLLIVTNRQRLCDENWHDWENTTLK